MDVIVVFVRASVYARCVLWRIGVGTTEKGRNVVAVDSYSL